MARPRRRELGPLYMERNAPWPQRSAETFGVAGPSPKAIEASAADLARRVAAGDLPWPPEDAAIARTNSLNVFGGDAPESAGFEIGRPWDFMAVPAVREFLRQLSGRFGLPEERRAVQVELPVGYEMFARYNWERAGRRVYVLDEGTYELLALTDLPRLPSRILHAPLSSFYVVFPEDAFRFEDAGAVQSAEGAFVVFDRVEGDDRLGRGMTVVVTGRSGIEGSDSFVFNYAFLGPASSLSDIRFNSAARQNFADEIVNDVPRAIVGLCLYLMSEHPLLEAVEPERRDLSAIKNPAKLRKAEAAQGRTTKLRTWYVGGGRDAPDDRAPGTRDGARPGRKLDQRVWVRGHWRHQPYGAGRALRRFMWIRPYLRGPDMAESVEMRIGKVQPARPKGTGR